MKFKIFTLILIVFPIASICHAYVYSKSIVLLNTDYINTMAVIHGQLWVGTQGGVVIFDNHLKTVRQISSEEGLPSNRITSIAGFGMHVFIATYHGLVHYDNAEEKIVDFRSDLEVTALACADDGVVLGTRTGEIGIWRVFGSGEITWLGQLGTAVTVIHIAKQDIWGGSISGDLFHWDHRNQSIDVRHLNRPIYDLNDDGNMLYICTAETTYKSRLYGGKRQYPLPIQSIRWMEVNSGHFSAISDVGVVLSGSLSPFTSNRFATGLSITCAVHFWNTICIGTRSGLYYMETEDDVFQNVSIQSVPMPCSCPVDRVMATADFNDWFWIIGLDGGVSAFTGVEWKHFSAPEYLPSPVTYGIVSDDQFLYVATRSGLAIFDGSVWTTISSSDGIKGHDLPRFVYPSVTSCTRDPVDGSIWISDQGTVHHLKNGRWYRYNYLENLQSTHIQAVSAYNGTCAVATSDRGVEILYRGTHRFVTFNERNGLSDNWLTDVAVGPDNIVWVTTCTKGICRIKPDGSVTIFRCEDGLPDDYALCVAIEKDRIWVGTQNGLGIFDQGVWTILTESDGLSGREINQIRFNGTTAILSTESGLTFLDIEGDPVTIPGPLEPCFETKDNNP